MNDSQKRTGGMASALWLLLAALFGGALFNHGGSVPETGRSKPADTTAAASITSEATPDDRVLRPLRTFLLQPEDSETERTANSSTQTCFPALTALLKCIADRSDRHDVWSDLRAADPGQVGELNFLIVHVADPLDTQVNYRFDQQVDTLHRALGEENYVLEGFYLPWKSGTKDAKSELHRTEPGLLLYRNATGPGSSTDLILAYLVGETPTQGIHKDAFRLAIRQIAQLCSDEFCCKWNTEQHQEGVMVFGSTFSGASDSLARVVRQCRADHPELPPFRVIGTATSVDRERFRELSGNHASFFGTVVGTELLKRALIKHVVDRNNNEQPRIAWLTESGTGYGAAARFGANAKKSRAKEKQPREDEKRSAEHSGGSIVEFRFPMNIASVRAQFQEHLRRERGAGNAGALGPDRYRLNISFEDAKAARDLPPSLTPSMSAPTAEVVLGQILATIRAEGIEYVGITATDIRDPIFLAEMIRDQAPDVQILLVTSDLLHLHSETHDALHGALVASSYSLFSEDQQWCFPFRGWNKKVVLSQQDFYGFYNAIVFLRGLQRKDYVLHEEGALLELTRQSCNPNPWPLAYGMPLHDVPEKAEAQFQPPVWLSMIGPTGIWPIKALNPQELATEIRAAGGEVDPEYTLRVKVTPKSWNSKATSAPHPSFNSRIAPATGLLILVWNLLALTYLIGSLNVQALRKRSAKSLGRVGAWAKSLVIGPNPTEQSNNHRLKHWFRIAMSFSLWIVVGTALGLTAIPFLITGRTHELIDEFWLGTLAVLASLITASLTGLIVLDLYLAVRGKQWPNRKFLRTSTVLTVVFWSMGLCWFSWTKLHPLTEPAGWLLLFKTWSDFWNGISLVLPIQLTVAGFLVLAYGLLWQASHLEQSNCIPWPAFPAADPNDAKDRKALQRKILFPIVTRWKTRRGILLITMVVVGSSRVDLQACKLEYSIVSPK